MSIKESGWDFLEKLDKNQKQAIAERDFRSAKTLLYGAHDPKDITRLEAKQQKALADMIRYK